MCFYPLLISDGASWPLCDVDVKCAWHWWEEERLGASAQHGVCSPGLLCLGKTLGTPIQRSRDLHPLHSFRLLLCVLFNNLKVSVNCHRCKLKLNMEKSCPRRRFKGLVIVSLWLKMPKGINLGIKELSGN